MEARPMTEKVVHDVKRALTVVLFSAALGYVLAQALQLHQYVR